VSPRAPAEGADGIADPKRRRWAIASVLAGMMVVVLDSTVVNIALPTIAASLQVPPAAAVQVVTAYQLGLILMLLPAAALGDSLGYRPVFAAGMGLFTAASLACALAPSLSWLVAARFTQGVGGAGVMSLGIALLRWAVPSHRLGTAIGWNALTVALSSAAGPALGAVILTFGPWPWLFVMNLPVGAGVVIAARALPDTPTTARPLNLTGAALSTGAFASLVLATGHLLRRGSFSLCLLASIFCFVGQTAALIALPFLLQYVFDLSPLQTALHLLPWPLAVAATGPLAGKLADRIGVTVPCLLGAGLLACGLGSAHLLSLHSQAPAVGVCMVLCGMGFGLFNVSNNRSIFMSVPRGRSAAAGSLQSTARLAGQTAGAVAMTLLFAAFGGHAARLGLALAAVFALAAGVTAAVRETTE
jgi:MFS transporter, DHA2 family, multidrug resistance protein